MNCYMNGPAPVRILPGGNDNGFTVFTKLSMMNQPVNLFVMMDEDQNTINDAEFRVRPQANLTTSLLLVDWPATYHVMCGGMSFADGHAIVKKWSGVGPAPANWTRSGIRFSAGTLGQSQVADLFRATSEPDGTTSPYTGW